MDGHVQLSNTNWTQWTLKKVKKGMSWEEDVVSERVGRGWRKGLKGI